MGSNSAVLPLLLMVFFILLALVVPRTYFQFVQPHVLSWIEKHRMKRMLAGDTRLLKMVAVQQSLFKSAPQFPHLTVAAQQLLLSNISYHIVAREGEHWDVGQTILFIDNVTADPNFETVAEVAVAGGTMEDVIARVSERNRNKED